MTYLTAPLYQQPAQQRRSVNCEPLTPRVTPRYWTVKQGSSRGRVLAVDIQAAAARAAQIGFKSPDSITLWEHR